MRRMSMSTHSRSVPCRTTHPNWVEFFSHPQVPYATKKDAKAWAQLQAELQLLREGYTSLAGPRPHRE